MKKSEVEIFTEQFRLLCLVLQGFKYQTAKQYLKLRQNHQNPQQLKTAMHLLPFNSAFDKMLNDILSTEMVLQERSDCFATPYALIMELDGEKKICWLPAISDEITQEAESLIALLRNKGALFVRDSKNMYPLRMQVWRYTGDCFYIDDVPMSEQAIHQSIEALPSDTLFCEYLSPASDRVYQHPLLHLVMVKTESDSFAEVPAYMTDISDMDITRGYDVPKNDPRVADARAFANYVCRKFRELPYIHLTFLFTESGFILMQFDTGRDLVYCRHLPPEVTELLNRIKKSRSALTWRQKKDQIYKYITSWQAKRKGFVDFMYRNWLRGLKDDRKHSHTNRREKRWAHRRGFYSYRIKQYHLNEENYRDILSDYDYKKLRPLNCRYHKWLWNKLMVNFVLWPFCKYMPIYYYRLIPENGKISIIPYDPTCENCSFHDIIELLKCKGKLALKPAVGSHGEGFYQLAFSEGRFFVNGKERSVEEIKNLIIDLKAACIVSEYIEMHHDLKRIYDRVACTIRVMTIQNSASSPIKNAYLRIGTSFTGNTDNLGSGGIAVPIDLETGHFEKAELLKGHEFVPCALHPDTNAPIQGYIPYWNDIKEKIREICSYLSPLEYLGFDVVVTEDNFKILEINTHQDLHKYTSYPQEVKDYFADKMARRKMK